MSVTAADSAGGDLDEIFAARGPLAGVLPGYAPRAQQRTMAGAVAAAIDRIDTLVVEAGTGVGKTLAYLIPALLSDKRIIISTGTRNLQDQLFHRDLPTVTAALGQPVRTALLKGRANYLCKYRLAQSAADPGRHADKPGRLAGGGAPPSAGRRERPGQPRVQAGADRAHAHRAQDPGAAAARRLQHPHARSAEGDSVS